MTSKTHGPHDFRINPENGRPQIVPGGAASATPITDALRFAVTFTFNGIIYKTNADASIVEGLDGTTWNRTHSLSVRAAAQEALGTTSPVVSAASATDWRATARKLEADLAEALATIELHRERANSLMVTEAKVRAKNAALIAALEEIAAAVEPRDVLQKIARLAQVRT